MNDLIAKLEAATGPDRVLDIMIHTRLPDAIKPLTEEEAREAEQYIMDHAVPHYTESIDGALRLMPEGHECSVDCYKDGTGAATVSPDFHDISVLSSSNHSANPAIALCIAALKARQAKEKT